MTNLAQALCHDRELLLNQRLCVDRRAALETNCKAVRRTLLH